MDQHRRYNVRDFILTRFSRRDYERGIELNNDEVFAEKFPTFQRFQEYQVQMVDLLDETNLAFAEYVKSFIQARLLRLQDKESMVTFQADGFYYLDGQLILTNPQ